MTSDTAQVEEYPAVQSFDDLNLREELLRGIYSYGFEVPSAIQRAPSALSLMVETQSPKHNLVPERQVLL